MAPFDCTMRMTTSDAGSPSDWMMTFECPSSDNHKRIDETMYGSSLPLTKTADAQAAPTHVSSDHEVEMWLSWMCTSDCVGRTFGFARR